MRIFESDGRKRGEGAVFREALFLTAEHYGSHLFSIEKLIFAKV